MIQKVHGISIGIGDEVFVGFSVNNTYLQIYYMPRDVQSNRALFRKSIEFICLTFIKRTTFFPPVIAFFD